MVMQGGVAATEPPRPIPNIGTSVSFTGTSRYKTVWDETVTTVVTREGFYGFQDYYFDRVGWLKWTSPDKGQIDGNIHIMDIKARKKDAKP